MYLRSLHLRQFRNYREQRVAFSAAKTILLGENAQGKSNLLEAIELLATLRSHRTHRDRDLILDGATAAMITAQVERDLGVASLAIAFRQGSRRLLTVNGENLRRQTDFLGTLNAVQFSSLDLELVRGSPELRRHWLDGLLIQLEPVYANLLQQYNHILKQRNALLKERQRSLARDQAANRSYQRQEAGTQAQVAASEENLGVNFTEQLAIWDAQLAIAGTRVIRRRSRAIQRVAPLAQHWHEAISGSQESLTITYLPSVAAEPDDPQVIQQKFLERLQERAIAEQFQGTTLVGPHRDEIEFVINRAIARQYGSQGQQRTFWLSCS